MEKAYMKNMLRSLLVTALAISAAHVNAHTNKTFLNPRTQDVSLSSEQASFYDLMKTNHMDRFGGNFQVTGYYSESTNKNDLGKYFAPKDASSFTAQIGGALAAGAIDLGQMIHDASAARGAAAQNNTISLQPVTRTYGVNFDYAQCLGKILDGLYLGVKLPVQKVENDMGLSVTGPQADAIKKYLAGNLSAATLAGAGVAPGLLGGAGQVNDWNSSQAALSALKINGKQSVTGIADIDVTLGYNFIRNEDWKAGLGIDLGIPTGNNVDGKNLFEPVYGSAHWSLGLNAHVCGTVWRGDNQKLSVHAKLAYAYGFKATEKRFVGTNEDLSQYVLVGKFGPDRRQQYQAQANSGITGLGTQDVDVTPGNMFRANVGASYHNGGLVFGLGYQPGWNDAESVSKKATLADNTIGTLFSGTAVGDNNPRVFGLANPPAVAADNGANGARTGVNNADVTPDAQPSRLEHRIGANLGYTFKEWEYPVSLALGGHYGFAGNNATAEQWAISLSAGIGF